ncbi:L-rhamnose isomerase RhaA [Victivallis vadensis]|uniref:L-rhamnose isomerase RhaA n=1 Tax=Victivallis vadensis TaxID=172901 RepID=A0A2U1AFM4_9BACT|nr:L-rhamnose isomerase RhaA [Victivallis vadensis]
MIQESLVCKAYELAKERYQAFGIDTDSVVEKLFQIPISVQCWQGDDIGGYEKRTGASGGGILTTGNYPGKARTADELRQDVDQLRTLVSGKFRFALHAIYLESEQPVDRREIRPEHFARWTAWAKDRGIGLDFNPTFLPIRWQRTALLFHPPMRKSANSGLTMQKPAAQSVTASDGNSAPLVS